MTDNFCLAMCTVSNAANCVYSMTDSVLYIRNYVQYNIHCVFHHTTSTVYHTAYIMLHTSGILWHISSVVRHRVCDVWFTAGIVTCVVWHASRAAHTVGIVCCTTGMVFSKTYDF